MKFDYEQLKESYENKREELNATKTLLESLQEEFIMTKNELEILKNKPLDKCSKGNSLFAEVDDRRVELVDEIKLIKRKYKLLKSENQNFVSKITELRNENTKLLQRWNEENKELKEGVDEHSRLKEYEFFI